MELSGTGPAVGKPPRRHSGSKSFWNIYNGQEGIVLCMPTKPSILHDLKAYR
ncbi:hypothetical protein [Oryza sativa Japonica Group]|uniref:Uncharacterized protein n=1 Tax=Oryza sativa subsp. japonica TaxID=39947 RepID=Q5QM73_ORYSJ|nr:hypothetical protein [Oryza sativa Japonica Group]